MKIKAYTYNGDEAVLQQIDADADIHLSISELSSDTDIEYTKDIKRITGSPNDWRVVYTTSDKVVYAMVFTYFRNGADILDILNNIGLPILPANAVSFLDRNGHEVHNRMFENLEGSSRLPLFESFVGEDSKIDVNSITKYIEGKTKRHKELSDMYNDDPATFVTEYILAHRIAVKDKKIGDDSLLRKFSMSAVAEDIYSYDDLSDTGKNIYDVITNQITENADIKFFIPAGTEMLIIFMQQKFVSTKDYVAERSYKASNGQFYGELYEIVNGKYIKVPKGEIGCDATKVKDI